MQIKINDKILSITPYISTNWSHIASLHMQENVLTILLSDGSKVAIPDLPKEIIEQIFNYHSAYLQNIHFDFPVPNQQLPSILKSEQFQGLFDQNTPSFRLGFGSLDGLGNVMQHNPKQADAPNLPDEILQKITSISKILVSEDLVLPTAEASCNCFYCQIARAINPHETIEHAHKLGDHEEVSDSDLHFQQWKITQTGDKLFAVTNGLDENEKYNVFLGEPLGCTCGNQGCEHIIAVLKS